MGKVVALAVLIGVALLPSAAQACRRMGPSIEALDQYTAVVLGRVTGVHLEGYETRLLGKPDLMDPQLGAVSITNGASPVGIRVAVTQTLRGSASGALELRLAGCTIDTPELKERGIFFMLPSGDFTVVAWERNSEQFASWLDELGATRHDR
jgi:hypothetical protein